MTPEQLSGVLTVVADLGDGATSAVYAALGAMILGDLTATILGGIALYITYKLSMKGLSYIRIEHQLRELRDASDIGSPGEYTSSEHRRLLAVLKEKRI